MDDLSKRIGALESGVSDIRAQLSAVTAVLPHLATKADLTGEIGALRGGVGAVRGGVGTLRGEMHSMKSTLIKWIVWTAIASVAAESGIAAAIARFVH